MIQPKRYNEAYINTLNLHKELIKNNSYARELEQKYHKIHHQYYRKSILSKTILNEEKPS